MIIQNPTLYLDMDGVLADFNATARTMLSASDRDETDAEKNGRWPDHQWRRILDYPNFYRILPKTAIADDLVALARRFRDQLNWDVKILTAVPKKNDMKEAFQDKFDWIQEYYPDLRIRFGPYSHDKHTHCRPGDILVDDRTVNCQEWKDAGGIAIRVVHSDQKNVLQQLEDIFNQQLSKKLSST